MKYVKGAIGFATKRKNWISRIIRWFTQSQWSHTFVVYQTEPEVLVVEAGTFTVQLVPATKYESRKYTTVFLEPQTIPGDRIDAGIAKARDKIESRYGWLQLVGFVPVIVFRRVFNKKISNPSKGGVVCSELVLQYLRGVEPGSKWDAMDKNTVSPEDIYKELESHSSFKLVDGFEAPEAGTTCPTGPTGEPGPPGIVTNTKEDTSQ